MLPLMEVSEQHKLEKTPLKAIKFNFLTRNLILFCCLNLNKCIDNCKYRIQRDNDLDGLPFAFGLWCNNGD